MMFRESVQVFICLSVLISSSVSLHMIRDAYHRPLNELNGINHDTILIDGNKNAKRIPDTADLSQMRAETRNPSSNNLKYHELFPSSLSSSSSVGASSFSSSSSSPSSSLPFSVSFRSGTLARSSGTDSDGRYRWQKQVTHTHKSSHLIQFHLFSCLNCNAFIILSKLCQYTAKTQQSSFQFNQENDKIHFHFLKKNEIQLSFHCNKSFFYFVKIAFTQYLLVNFHLCRS